MIFLSEADVARLVTVGDALEAVEAAFRLQAAGQARGVALEDVALGARSRWGSC